MRDLIRSLLPVIIIISIFSTSLIIPGNCLARYEIRKEETFGEPGNDPTLNPDPLESTNDTEISGRLNTSYSEDNEISILLLFSKTLLNQIASFIL